MRFSLYNKYGCSLFLVCLHCISVAVSYYFNSDKYWLTMKLKKYSWSWDSTRSDISNSLDAQQACRNSYKTHLLSKNTALQPTDIVQTPSSFLFHLQHLVCTKTRNQTHPPARITFSNEKSLALVALPSVSLPPSPCCPIKEKLQRQADEHVRTHRNLIIWGCWAFSCSRLVYTLASVMICRAHFVVFRLTEKIWPVLV